MKWAIIVLLCLVLTPVVYRILKGTITFLAKLTLVFIAIAIVGCTTYYLFQ
jgi:hypothetical protein